MDQFWKKFIESWSLIKKTCLKPYIDINTELRKEAKKDFEKDFFKLINNAKTWKMLENTESLNL